MYAGADVQQSFDLKAHLHFPEPRRSYDRKNDSFALCLLGTCADERSSRYAHNANVGENEAEKQAADMDTVYHLRSYKRCWSL